MHLNRIKDKKFLPLKPTSMLETTARTLGLLSGMITLGLKLFSDPTVFIRAFFFDAEEAEELVFSFALAVVEEIEVAKEEEEEIILRDGSVVTGLA
jgi:hypothetical protein